MRCVKCIMDNSDPEIKFDENGICNHCKTFEKLLNNEWFPNENGKSKLDLIISNIKNEGKGNNYDCILGLSGGVDSSYLALKVKGKTGEREVTLRNGAIRYLDRLRKMNEDWRKYSFENFLKKKLDAYVFRVDDKDMTETFGKMFSRFLERCELLIDPTSGKHRTLYSLRHMYAVFALTYNRMSVYTLAKHMGTSVAMIEKHYGQILLRNNAAEIAGKAVGEGKRVTKRVTPALT